MTIDRQAFIQLSFLIQKLVSSSVPPSQGVSLKNRVVGSWALSVLDSKAKDSRELRDPVADPVPSKAYVRRQSKGGAYGSWSASARRSMMNWRKTSSSGPMRWEWRRDIRMLAATSSLRSRRSRRLGWGRSGTWAGGQSFWLLFGSEYRKIFSEYSKVSISSTEDLS